jgi:hypothetical protein
MKSGPITSLMVPLIALAGLAAAADAPPAPEGQPAPARQTTDEVIDGMRKPYLERHWRVGVAAGDTDAGMNVQYRLGRHAGLGLAFEGLDERDTSGYDHTVLGAQGWWERASRLFPFVAGLAFTAGPMLTTYAVDVPRVSGDIGSGFGAGGILTAYILFPVFSLFMETPQPAWLPHLSFEIAHALGWIGRMTNDGDSDLNGDGVVEHRGGEAFTDPGGSVRRWVYWNDERVGFVWIF